MKSTKKANRKLLVKSLITKFFILSLLLTTLAACSAQNLIGDTPTATVPTTVTETSFCATSTSYSPGVAVSGTAKFRRRGLNLQINSGVVTSATTGAIIATALPIKWAEVRVLNSAGSIIQCGTTNSSGELRALNGTSPLFIPIAAGNYTIEVYARANYTFPTVGKPVSATLSTAVKEDIYSNTVYKIAGTFTSSGFGGGANAPLNLIAQASEFASSKIEGGAFNMYNDWVTAFEYLIDTANTGSLDVSCLNPKLDMYWKAGFNPAAYINPNGNPNSTISFYLRDHHELFICGGVLGDVSTKDTDHWDDTVILHEMGHHIENVCGNMDSPGGAHSAQYRIDPRLAWSEAWGNFIGGHIVKNNTSKINPNLPSALPNGEWLHYSDTVGYIEGSPTFNGSAILIRLNSTGQTSLHDNVNPTLFPGESHTREASIARGLFKGVNTCTNCGGGIGFDKYWTALGTSINGMGYSLSPFSSSAKFFAKVFTANGNTFSASMTTITTTDEALHRVGTSSLNITANTSSTGNVTANAWPGYGIKLTTNTSCNVTAIQPRNLDYTFGLESDQRYTNHFYAFRKADLGGVSQIRLVPDSSCQQDLDLIVFNLNYEYIEDCDSNLASCSTKAALDGTNSVTHSRGSTGTEAVSISGLASSYYLLNVRAFATNPNTISGSSTCAYRLTDQGGNNLCPSTSY